MHLYLYDISRTLQPVQSPGLNCYKLQVNAGYCSDIRQSSGNHAPKSVIIHTSIACMPIKTSVGVNVTTPKSLETVQPLASCYRHQAMQNQYYSLLIFLRSIKKV